MRILSIIVIAAVIGLTVGGAMAYIEVRLDPDAPPQETSATALQPVSPTQGEPPRAQVEERNFQFGTMQRGTTKSHEFVIKNVGGAPLTLEVGPTSCKCTLGDVTNQPIPPGESTHVRLEWSAKSESGAFRQSAMIRTNDPTQREIELSIEGHITDAMGVSPPDFIFDKIQHGQSKSAQVYVMAMLQDDLSVSEAMVSDPESRDHFDVKIEEAKAEELPNPQARKGVRITVTAKPDMPVGRFNQWLSLRTNLPEAEKLEIPIFGRIVGDIRVDGNAWNDELGVLLLGHVKSQEGLKSRVNLFVRGSDAAGVKFAVQSVDPPELRVTIGEPKKLKETMMLVPVEIEVPPGTRPMVRLDTAQGEEGRIVLSTTHPTNKELVLAVRLSVEK